MSSLTTVGSGNRLLQRLVPHSPQELRHKIRNRCRPLPDFARVLSDACASGSVRQDGRRTKSNAGSVQGKVLYAFANKEKVSVASGGLRTGAVLKLSVTVLKRILTSMVLAFAFIPFSPANTKAGGSILGDCSPKPCGDVHCAGGRRDAAGCRVELR
jgi:hypothetical protein